MQTLDLTRPLRTGMPSYPGTPGPQCTPLTDLPDHGFREQSLSLTTHTGTHCDAPAHVLPTGPTLDQLPPETWTGPGVRLDLRPLKPGQPVTPEMLRPLLPPPEVLSGAWLLLCTGWASQWGADDYFADQPEITPEAAALLGRCGLRGLGLDMASLEGPHRDGLPAHHVLLESGCVLAENLCRLEDLPAAGFTFICAPLSLLHADGAPCRALALLP
jgi:kynurenine formamidase